YRQFVGAHSPYSPYNSGAESHFRIANPVKLCYNDFGRCRNTVASTAPTEERTAQTLKREPSHGLKGWSKERLAQPASALSANSRRVAPVIKRNKDENADGAF
ncbi:MAG: hypothetical protein RR946_09890, partial [Clostridia bacterium]